MKRIYFDNNATTFLDPLVVDAIHQLLKTPYGNPSSLHYYGQTSKAILSHARRTIASYLKVNQNQIIFTSGGSESANLLIRGSLRGKTKGHLITSSIEHACVYETFEFLQTQGFDVTFLPVDHSGTIAPDQLANAIRPDTVLISLMAVNNETGVKNDLKALSLIAEKGKIPFIVDGVAWLGKEVIEIPKGVSAIFFSGHKIHAPQGIGFIYRKSGLKWGSEILGGAQEFGLRGGTENLIGITGLTKAIEILSENQNTFSDHLLKMRISLENGLLKIPGIQLNGTAPRLCNTVNLAFDRMDGESLLIKLDQAGVAVSLGSACSSGIEPSRVLLKMGYPIKRVKNSLRFSLSRFNTIDEIEDVIKIIKNLLTL